jgi:hypothetical protein
MGKQSRRNRQSSKVARQKPKIVRLDLSNPFDANIKKKADLKKQYIPLLTEPIGQEPSNHKDLAKYDCRYIRRNVARQLVETLEQNINVLLDIKIGIVNEVGLEVYDTGIELKIAHIKFLSHMHNNNLPKATKYYLKWKECVSGKLDRLMFGECTNKEYVEFEGKRVDADKDEAVRLMGEMIKRDVEYYTMMWAVIFEALIPE